MKRKTKDLLEHNHRGERKIGYALWCWPSCMPWMPCGGTWAYESSRVGDTQGGDATNARAALQRSAMETTSPDTASSSSKAADLRDSGTLPAFERCL